MAFRDGAGIVLIETLTEISVGVSDGTGVAVAVTVGELVAVLVMIDDNEYVGFWVEGWLRSQPSKDRPQAGSKIIIMRQEIK